MEPFKISLEAARVNAGLNQRDAAKRLGITPETLRNYEKRKTSPTMEIVNKLSELYSVPITHLFF